MNTPPDSNAYSAIAEVLQAAGTWRVMYHMMAALFPASVKHCRSCNAAICAGSVVADKPAQRITVIIADARINRCALVRARILGARKKNRTSLTTPTTHSIEITAVDRPLAVQ
ncbi:hypothetical protein D3C71_1023040 [compost metagenome]